MTRMNRKGFLLIESLIVVTFIMTIFTFIYKNSVPLIAEYNRRSGYDDIDSVYAINLMRNLLVQDDKFDELVSGISDGSVLYKDITDCNLWSQKDMCNTLKEQFNIVPTTTSNDANNGKIYITRFELSKLKDEVEKGNIFNQNTERGIKTYIDYLPNYTTSEVLTGYRMIIVRNILYNGEETQKYANIEVIPQ